MLKIIFLLLSLVVVLKAASWNYTDTTSWATSFANCGGSRQSPINIDTKIINRRLKLRLEFKHFDMKPNTMSWLNNGHTAVLKSTYNISCRPSIQNLENGETYIVDALHYHWGSNNNVGSEHTINGFSYPLEMHIVTWNQRYGSLANAVSSPNGLLVLGNFFIVSDSAENDHLSYLGTIVQYDDTFDLPTTYSLKTILRKIPKRYYFYSGSLTTPTCDETVQWVVIKRPLKVRNENLIMFRSLRDASGNPITFNYRPVQPLNTRSIGQN